MPKKRQSLACFVEGHYLSKLAEFLRREGILQTLDVPKKAEALAVERALDPSLLRLALTFVADRSDLLEATPAGFVRSGKYTEGRCEWVLDQYLGAYGPLVADVGEILRESSRGPDLVDGMHRPTPCSKGPPTEPCRQLSAS